MKLENIGSTLDSLFDELGEPRPRVPSLADLERAVEEAWDKWDGYGGGGLPILNAVRDWLAARRASHAAGYVSVLVSREAVEALREARAYRVYPSSAGDAYRSEKADALDFLACEALARDLAAVLKPDGQP
jgi:hypothetical protein